MKITQITPLLIKPSLLVRVTTDGGHVGYGECSAMNIPVVVAHLRHALAPIVLGRDAFDLEAIVEDCLVKTYKIAGQANAIALSGIELALWDLMGKALGVPCYKLLGGAIRRRIAVYASSMRRDTTPEQEADRLANLVEAHGFGGVKLKVGGRQSFDKDASPGRTVGVVREVRRRLGDGIDILVDGNSSFSAPRAIEVGRRLEEFGMFHYEEPCAYSDLEAHAKVADALDVPIALGEQEWELRRFKSMLTSGAAQILQPDIIKAGGFTVCRKVAALCEAFGAVCTPHMTSPFGTVANLHLAASTPALRYAQEYNIEPHPLRQALFVNDPLKVVDGHLNVPEEPGLGIMLNPELLGTAEEL